MLLANTQPDHNRPLDPVDVDTLSVAAAEEVVHWLSYRENHDSTPLHSLAATARDLGLGSIHVKDESFRLGMGSFKALGGSYAVIRLVLEEAERQLGRAVDISQATSSAVRAVAETMTVGCATDGNHGRSVAVGAKLLGAKAVIFLHAGVSEQREQAIAECGARIIRVDGAYDDSVAEAERICGENGWMVVSDTSWPGYERIPGLVMQGYTAMLHESVQEQQQPPTHVFIQAGVGGLAAAVAGYFTNVYGNNRPCIVVVEPDRAACIYESAVAGKRVKTAHGESTIMAMLECYEPSLVAWRILARAADVFMTISEEDAANAMRRHARPLYGDPVIISGESGCAGFAGLLKVMRDKALQQQLDLDSRARVLLFNTEGATDEASYENIVGASPQQILTAA